MNKGIRYVVGLGAGLCFGLMAGAAGAQGMVGPSLADAKEALAVAEAAAVEMDIGLTCAVVDSRGTLVALARMDNARYFTADVAVGKARASAAFGAPSGRTDQRRRAGAGHGHRRGRHAVPSGSRPDHEERPGGRCYRLQRCCIGAGRGRGQGRPGGHAVRQSGLRCRRCAILEGVAPGLPGQDHLGVLTDR